MAAVRALSITTPGFWRGYWVTLRPYLFFISGVSGLVGLALPGQVSWAALAAAFAAFFFSYGLGQAVTDVFQTDTDAISSPYRPLTQGVIGARPVLVISLAGLGLCALVFVLLNPWTILLSGLGVAGLLTYTPFKRRWWAGPFWNAWIVALLPAIGALCVSGGRWETIRSPALWAAMVSVFFSYAVFVLLGYFKDISADRATGYETLPVRYGWSVSVQVSAALTFFAVAASTYLIHLSGLLEREGTLGTYFAWGYWIAGAATLAAAHGLMIMARGESEAHRSIGCVVRGYVLLHLGEAVTWTPALAWPALGFYLLFELVLACRPERSQI